MENNTKEMSNESNEVNSHYRIKQLFGSIFILLLLSLIVVFVLPSSKKELSEEDKIQILENISARLAIQRSLLERQDILDDLVSGDIAQAEIMSKEDRAGILESLQ